jgi:tetratricopeptide (TPR) repeat protein
MHAVQSVTRMVIEEETDDGLPVLPELPASPRNRQRWLWFTVAALAFVAAGSLLAWQRLHRRTAQYIDIVLSDLENRTNDRDFDQTLNQALQIDLEQSPYLHLLSRSRIQETLIEMQRKPNDPLTMPVAAEICERNNALVMLHGSVARIGNQYLLILNAESCVTGKQVAGYKADVSSKEEVLSALDTAAARVRGQLGESAASLDQYKIPVTQATTPSLEALRAYSEAIESFRRGEVQEARTLLQQAITLDPRFASAYRVLGSSYRSVAEYDKAAQYFKQSFDLREGTTKRERLDIEMMYYAYSVEDFEEAIRRAMQSLEIYPNVAGSWALLCNLYTELGQYPQAIAAGEQAMRLDPRSGTAPGELARAYLRSNRFGDVRRIANAAVGEGKDSWALHSILFQIAVVEKDPAAIKSEGE